MDIGTQQPMQATAGENKAFTAQALKPPQNKTTSA
jgi:hypothetical protein